MVAYKKARSGGKYQDPQLIKEKVSRIAYESQVEVTAILSEHGVESRARELLRNAASAYKHYDNPAGASFRATKVRPALPVSEPLLPARGLLQSRNVLGVRELAALWHPLGAGDELPMVARSGARVLFPLNRGVSGGAHVGNTVGSRPRKVHFQEDTLRRHHLYVARTRMGKSTLMEHIVAHKMREKAAGRDSDAIVVIDPHADLVKALLKHVPEGIVDRVRLIDLGDDERAPGINLLEREGVHRPGPHRRLGGAGGPRGVGAVGTEDAVYPGAHGEEPPRVQPPPGHGGGGAADHPGRAEDAVRREVPQPGAQAGGRPLRGGLVGKGPAQLDAHDPLRCPGPVQTRLPTTPPPRRPGPSWDSPAPPSTCGRPSGVEASCWSRRPKGTGPGRLGPGGGVAAQPSGLGDPGAGKPAHGAEAGSPGGGGRDAVHPRRGLRGHVG